MLSKGEVVGKKEQRSERMSAAVVDRVVQMRECRRCLGDC